MITVETIVLGCIGVLIGICGYLISSRLSAIDEKLKGVMTKDVCDVYHASHDKEHLRFEKDINALWKKFREEDNEE
jgi:hypothetical protein